MPIFRKAAPQEPLIIAMAGVRLGDRVLILAADDLEMVADIGAKVGLSGRAVALSANDARAARVSARAEQRGVLVESLTVSDPLPFPAGIFDLAIADNRRDGRMLPDHRLSAVLGVLRPGGRLVTLERAALERLRLPWRPPPGTTEHIRELEQRLVTAGFRAARQLGSRRGTSFVEAIRAG